MKTRPCFFTVKFQESNARAQRGEQQKAMNMLDITAAATFRPAAFLQDLGTLHTIFFLRVPLLTLHITAVSFYTLKRAPPLQRAEILEQQSVRKFQSVTALDCESQSPAIYLLPKLRGIILIVEVRVEDPGKVRDIPLWRITITRQKSRSREGRCVILSL